MTGGKGGVSRACVCQAFDRESKHNKTKLQKLSTQEKVSKNLKQRKQINTMMRRTMSFVFLWIIMIIDMISYAND